MRARVNRQRLIIGVVILGLVALGVLWGKGDALSQATAQVPARPAVAPPPVTPAPVSGESSQRVVAYIYGDKPITRSDLGEYLIARMEPERINNLVNKYIIELAAQQKGIEVTAAEVEADLEETIRGLGTKITRQDFVNTFLKPYHKTLYEWKEDVVKPRLMLTKMCRDRVTVTEQDLVDAFEAYHGEKVECQIIMWPSSTKAQVMGIYGKLRDSEVEFNTAAKTQGDPKLASTAGHIAPFGRKTTGNELLEQTAFALKPGEISQLIDTPEGLVVIKCIKHLQPDGTKLEDVRAQLTKDIINRKINQIEIPRLFADLQKQAQPKVFLQKPTTEEELLRDVRKELSSAAGAKR